MIVNSDLLLLITSIPLSLKPGDDSVGWGKMGLTKVLVSEVYNNLVDKGERWIIPFNGFGEHK